MLYILVLEWIILRNRRCFCNVYILFFLKYYRVYLYNYVYFYLERCSIGRMPYMCCTIDGRMPIMCCIAGWSRDWWNTNCVCIVLSAKCLNLLNANYVLYCRWNVETGEMPIMCCIDNRRAVVCQVILFCVNWSKV
jgi:hypothetical protein